MKGKSKFSSFLAGVVSTVLVLGLSVTAFAASNGWNITVYPINIKVDGEVFQPKDGNGKPVEVFTYNGTTYAPLRALAEAYGLTVGYDSKTKTATVTRPGQESTAVPATSSDFTSQWEVKEKPVTDYGSEKVFTATYSGGLGKEDFKTWWKSFSEDEISRAAEQLAAEAQSLNPGYTVTMYFSYGTYSLGTAFAYGEYEVSGFKPASVWIK